MFISSKRKYKTAVNSDFSVSFIPFKKPPHRKWDKADQHNTVWFYYRGW